MRSTVRFSFASFLVAGLLAFGCAAPTTPGTTGSAGSTGPGAAGTTGGGNTSGSAGTTGGGNTSGSAGTTGGGNTSGTAGSSATGTAGTGGPACVSDPTNLVRTGGWICDATQPYMIQGAWYGYGDGTSCPATTPNPCGDGGGCCMMGATVVDATYAKWGCGIGMELASSGGTTPTKTVYMGPTKCFNITLTGNSGGNPVRIGFSQSPMPATTAVAPYKEIPAFTNGWMGQVCFADVTCPTWAVTAMTCTKGAGDGTPVDMQLQIPGGDRAGNFNVCISKVEPVGGGSTGTGGSGGGTTSCMQPSGSGTITDRYGAVHVMCPKDYVVQNNAWGSAAGQTITFGPGTKFKVTRQQENGTSTTPASYPSIFTGANSGNSTTGSGLPRAVSQITAGSLQTSFTWADNGATGSYNASYDVWFSSGSGGDPMSASAPSGGYLMVWFNDSPQNQPIGSLLQANGQATIGGKQFSIWYGTNTGSNKPVVSYVAQQNFFSWTFSLGDFIQDAVARNCAGTTKCVNSSWALTNVFAGFEIWNGGVNLEVKDFGVTVP